MWRPCAARPSSSRMRMTPKQTLSGKSGGPTETAERGGTQALNTDVKCRHAKQRETAWTKYVAHAYRQSQDTLISGEGDTETAEKLGRAPTTTRGVAPPITEPVNGNVAFRRFQNMGGGFYPTPRGLRVKLCGKRLGAPPQGGSTRSFGLIPFAIRRTRISSCWSHRPSSLPKWRRRRDPAKWC